MQTVTIPGINNPVSRIVLGTMIIDAGRQDDSDALLDAAFENGIRTFDTAWVYAGGNSERGIGSWLARRGLRDQVVILSKGCHPNGDRPRVTPFDLYGDVHDCLARLQVDCVDLYMFHRDDPAVAVGGLVDAMNELIQAGKICAYGASNWTHARIQEANDYAEANGLVPFAASSPNFGLAEQVKNPWGPGCISLSGAANAEGRAWHEQNQLPVFAYSSLGRGLFSGRVTRENYRDVADGACQAAYCHEVNFQRLDRARQMAAERGVTVAQIALAYVLGSPVNACALVGAANRAECEALVEAQTLNLPPQDCAWLESGD